MFGRLEERGGRGKVRSRKAGGVQAVKSIRYEKEYKKIGEWVLSEREDILAKI
jgi:hypothetical protein